MWFNETFYWDEETLTLSSDFKPFFTEAAAPADLLHFCWIHIKCNMYSEIKPISYNSEYYYGIHIDTLNSICERFFGRTLSRDEIPSGEKDQYGRNICLLVGDYVCKIAADGETYPNMTVSNKIYDMENGLYQIDFTIYTVNDVGGDNNIVAASGIIHDKSVYYFTPEEATSHPAFSYHLMGTAVVKPYVTPKGTNTYQLISYELFAEDKGNDTASPLESTASTEDTSSNPPDSESNTLLSVQDLVGEWNIDTSRTMEHNGQSMTSMFGKPYSDSMSFGSDGSFRFYITHTGGEGSYNLSGTRIEYTVTDWYDSEIKDSLEITEIDNEVYLIQYIRDICVFWKKT